MKWFDSDYDYIDEFTTQWNERYKKAKKNEYNIKYSIDSYWYFMFCVSRKGIHNDSNYRSHWLDCLGCM